LKGSIRYTEDGPVYMLRGRVVSKEEFDRAIPSKKIDYEKGELPGLHTDYGDWSQENGGRGRYCPQKAQKARDPNGYCRSRNELIEWAHSKDKTVEKD